MNLIYAVPAATMTLLQELVKLEILNVSFNQLVSVGDVFSKLKNLKWVLQA
jgi:hypothetical protein